MSKINGRIHTLDFNNWVLQKDQYKSDADCTASRTARAGVIINAKLIFYEGEELGFLVMHIHTFVFCTTKIITC